MTARVKRVLVVDGDEPIRRIITHHLVKNGFWVLQAEDGLEALETARTTPVDLILLDIRMPMLDGYELAERLHADPATADVPIAVCRVAADEAEPRVLHARAFLLRPFLVRELVEAVQAAVASGSRADRAS